MKRFLIAGLVALAAVAAVPAMAEAPRASLHNFVCQRAIDPAERALSVQAVMRPVPGTERMAMRFVLLKRSKRHGRSVAIAGSGLGHWITPGDPTLGSQPGDTWVVTHPVVDLASQGYYRLKVTFRWSNANHQVLAAAVRYSRQCFQPELRPDLAVTSIAVSPASQAGQDSFTGEIRNLGRTAAGSFQVEFTDGSVVTTKTVSHLAAHRQVSVHFVGPACSAGAPARIMADPSGQVNDANRANNALQTSCS